MIIESEDYFLFPNINPILILKYLLLILSSSSLYRDIFLNPKLEPAEKNRPFENSYPAKKLIPSSTLFISSLS